MDNDMHQENRRERESRKRKRGEKRGGFEPEGGWPVIRGVRYVGARQSKPRLRPRNYSSNLSVERSFPFKHFRLVDLLRSRCRFFFYFLYALRIRFAQSFTYTRSRSKKTCDISGFVFTFNLRLKERTNCTSLDSRRFYGEESSSCRKIKNHDESAPIQISLATRAHPAWR